MRANKKVFIISLITILICIIAIILFTVFKKCSVANEVFLNIFISLFGGAFLSAVTVYISFTQTKKDYEINFYSNVNSLNNILLEILNWYNLEYDKIRYGTTFDTSKMTIEQATEARSILFDDSDKKIKRFIKLVAEYKDYNYDEMIQILDDYRGLLLNKKNKVKQIMIDLRNELNRFNIDYNGDMCNAYTLYEMGKYPEVAIYNTITVPFLTETDIRNEKLDKLLSLRKKYLELTNLVEYTKKQQ